MIVKNLKHLSITRESIQKLPFFINQINHKQPQTVILNQIKLSQGNAYYFGNRKNTGFKWSTKFKDSFQSQFDQQKNKQQNTQSNQQSNNDFYNNNDSNNTQSSEEHISEEAHNNANAEFFSPSQKLTFVKDRARIYEYQIYEGIRKGYMIMMLGCSLLTYFLFSKLYNFRERSYFGLFFYGVAAILVAPRIYGLAGIFNKIIKYIDLCKDGRHVILRYGRLGIFTVEQKVDIAQISKPVDAQEGIKMQFAFPVQIGGKVFFLPKDQHKINKEVLQAVFNGRYIDIQESVEEIIIENGKQ